MKEYFIKIGRGRHFELNPVFQHSAAFLDIQCATALSCLPCSLASPALLLSALLALDTMDQEKLGADYQGCNNFTKKLFTLLPNL